MKLKAHLILFALIVFLYLAIIFSPLNYTSLNYSIIHLWFALIYGTILLLRFVKDKNRKNASRVASFTILPILALTTLYVYAATPNNVKVIPIERSNLTITYNCYPIFMAGNPQIDASIGYSFFGDLLIWELNGYSNGGGESVSNLNQYNLPYRIDDGEAMILFPNEGYLYDGQRDEVHRISKKKF
jgi:hypothetical protein